MEIIYVATIILLVMEMYICIKDLVEEFNAYELVLLVGIAVSLYAVMKILIGG